MTGFGAVSTADGGAGLSGAGFAGTVSSCGIGVGVPRRCAPRGVRVGGTAFFGRGVFVGFAVRVGGVVGPGRAVRVGHGVQVGSGVGDVGRSGVSVAGGGVGVEDGVQVRVAVWVCVAGGVGVLEAVEVGEFVHVRVGVKVEVGGGVHVRVAVNV